MFSYRALLKQAWKITWDYKPLWLFGVFASIAAASGSFEYQILVNNFQNGALENSYYHLGMFLMILKTIGNFILGLINLFSYSIFDVINTLTVLIITGTIVVSFVWLSITSQGALVLNSKKLIAGKKKPSELDIRNGFAQGNKYFWQILGFNVLAKFSIAVILFIISLLLVFLAGQASSLTALLYTLGFIVFVPLAIAASLILKYAIAYLVLDHEDFFPALKKSWRLFIKNWLVSVEMGIVLFLISFLVGFILLALLSIFIFPYFVFAIDYGIGWLIITLALISFFLLLISSAMLSTFQISAWTGLFLDLKNNRGLAKLERLFRR